MTSIFSADMTKLIAADSFLTPLGNALPWAAVTMDPDAPASFEGLCNILTNDSLIAFNRPKHLPRRMRPIMAAWSNIDNGLIGDGKVQPLQHEPLTQLSAAALCQVMVEPFNQYARNPETVRKLIRFAHFQFSDPELMRIFWLNNTEAELQIAAETLRQHDDTIIRRFATAFRRPPVLSIDAISVDRLTGKQWTADKFIIAYVFWGFAKGYRSAAALGPHHVYAVHWLREHAMKAGIEFRTTEEAVYSCFPWGHLLAELVRHPEFQFDNDAVTAGILNLRMYTIKDLYRATDQTKANEFAQQGLEQCLPKELYSANAYRWLSGSAKIAGILFSKASENAWMIPAMVTTLDLALPDRAKSGMNAYVRQIRLWSHRRTISSLVRRHHQDIDEYLAQRQARSRLAL